MDYEDTRGKEKFGFVQICSDLFGFVGIGSKSFGILWATNIYAAVGFVRICSDLFGFVRICSDLLFDFICLDVLSRLAPNMHETKCREIEIIK